LFTASHCFLLLAFDGKRVWTYLMYVVPLFAALFAVCLVNAWRARLLPRTALASVCLVFLAVQCATTWSRIVRDDYDRWFVPVTRFLASHAKPAMVIMGPSELGFGLGFHSNLVDDTRLGCLSGKRAAYVVIDKFGYAAAIQFLAAADPNCYSYIRNQLADNYRPVYSSDRYVVYERSAPGFVSIGGFHTARPAGSIRARSHPS
jgi:hypothetical protein